MTCLAPPAERRAPESLADYRERYTAAIRAARPNAAAEHWRRGVFERGLRVARELEARRGPLAGQCVLDVAAGYGGDLVACCARGATCVGFDRADHAYEHLCATMGLGERLGFVRGDCTRAWPFAKGTFDVVVSLGVLELLEDVDFFFGELFRVLRPDGCALVDTAPALRGLWRDPHFKLPLIALLPPRPRTWVAKHVFRRKYRFPLAPQTLYSVEPLARRARQRGWVATPCKYANSRRMAQLARLPLGGAWQALFRRYVFDFVFIARAPVAGWCGPPADAPA